MTASTPGSSHTERVGRETVPPVKVTTFEEQKEIRDIMGGFAEDKVSVASGLDKNRS